MEQDIASLIERKLIHLIFKRNFGQLKRAQVHKLVQSIWLQTYSYIARAWIHLNRARLQRVLKQRKLFSLRLLARKPIVKIVGFIQIKQFHTYILPIWKQ